MLRTVLQVTGLARTLGNLKLRLEDRAEAAVAHVKAIAVRIAVAAALAVAAVIFTVLALVAGLVALYAWLQPAYGVVPALGIVGGSLVVIALLLVLGAALVGRGKTERSSKTVELAGDFDEDPAYAARPSRRAFASREQEAAADAVDSLVSLARPNGYHRHRAPGADRTATDAATLLQSGDRRTMVAVLGAVAAVGWLLGRTTAYGGRR